MSNTVHVTGISNSTSEKEVRDFFSFCGKITNLDVKPESGADGSQTATVTFEKSTASKTALLLDNTQLGSSQVHVTAGGDLSESAAQGQATAGNEDDLAQEDKPRSRIVAEYLAHGYNISDKAIERAIALDQQHGISNRFTSALSGFDNKYQATNKAKGLDEKYSLSDTANKGWLGLNSYFEKALSTPTGQKLHGFYVSGSKQVLDVHNEARRLADLKAGKNAPEQVPGTNKTVCKCGSETGKCGCAPGSCACADCGKSSSAATQEVKEAAGESAANPTTATS